MIGLIAIAIDGLWVRPAVMLPDIELPPEIRY